MVIACAGDAANGGGRSAGKAAGCVAVGNTCDIDAGDAADIRVVFLVGGIPSGQVGSGVAVRNRTAVYADNPSDRALVSAGQGAARVAVDDAAAALGRAVVAGSGSAAGYGEAAVVCGNSADGFFGGQITG